MMFNYSPLNDAIYDDDSLEPLRRQLPRRPTLEVPSLGLTGKLIDIVYIYKMNYGTLVILRAALNV